MNEKSIRIGTVGFPLSRREKVYADVDVVEVVEGFDVPPLPKTARRRRKEAPATVAFTVQLPKYLWESAPSKTSLPGAPEAYGRFRLSEENLDLWQRAIQFAQGFGATDLVLKTPASFTPSKSNADALTQFLTRVDRQEFGVVWEPDGAWEADGASRLARRLDLVLAVDPLRDVPPEGERAYFKLGPFAVLGSRLGVYDLERLAEASDPFERSTYVFDTRRALDDARNLRAIFNAS